MTPQMIKGVWTYVGAHLDVAQFPFMFRTWEHEMSEISLRMRITLQQAAWTVLTQYSSILKMFREYPGFPWARVAALLPADWENFRAAVEAVGGDAYYGFKANVGPAAATNFPSLGYLAKEMIKKTGGREGSAIEQYKGWIQQPKAKESLDALVTAWNPAGPAGALEPDEAAVEALRGTLAAHPVLPPVAPDEPVPEPAAPQVPPA